MSKFIHTLAAIDDLKVALAAVEQAVNARNFVGEHEPEINSVVTLKKVKWPLFDGTLNAAGSLQEALEDVPMILNALANKHADTALTLLQLVEHNMRAEMNINLDI